MYMHIYTRISIIVCIGLYVYMCCCQVSFHCVYLCLCLYFALYIGFFFCIWYFLGGEGGRDDKVKGHHMGFIRLEVTCCPL